MFRLIVIACCLLLSFLNNSSAAIPDLAEGVRLNDAAAPLKVDGYSVPTVADWNNDGRKDLIVGSFTYGYIYLYLNQGSDTNPVFNGGVRIQSNGSDITTSWG